MPPPKGPPGSDGPAFKHDWGYWSQFPEVYPDYFTFKMYFVNYTPYTFNKGSGGGDSFIALSQGGWTIAPANASPFPDDPIVPSVTTITYKWVGERRKGNDVFWWMEGPGRRPHIMWALEMKFNAENPIPECSADQRVTEIDGKKVYEVDIKTVNMDPNVKVVPEGEERAVWFRMKAPSAN